MEQILSSPVPRHVRRAVPASRTAAPCPPADPRWSLLDLVRICRDRLGLRDRDITVLRGLLSLLPAGAETEGQVVFASNRVLIDRCDGIDERTLRRRIGHLGTRGLIARRSSPNGKRYQIRDDAAEVRLTYGIDLGPLFRIREHLQALADQCRREEMRAKALRAVLRDILYHHAARFAPDLATQAQRALRRKLSAEQVQDLIDTLHRHLPDPAPAAAVLSASDSQNDRQIQSSDKDHKDSDCAEKRDALTRPAPTPARAAKDLTVAECMDLARNAADFAPRPPRDWEDVVDLSTALAPAIGLDPQGVATARREMGPHGCALAILGLVEAFGRIRNPQAYLQALAIRARTEGIDAVRMFKSLVRPRSAPLRATA